MAGTVVGLIVGGHVLVVVAQRGPAIVVAVMAVCIAAGAVLGLLVGRMWLDGRRQAVRRRAEMRRLRDELEGRYRADLAAAEERHRQEVTRLCGLLEQAGAERVEMERRHDRQTQAHLAAIAAAYAYLGEAEQAARQHERVIMEQVADIQLARQRELHEAELEEAIRRAREEERAASLNGIDPDTVRSLRIIHNKLKPAE